MVDYQSCAIHLSVNLAFHIYHNGLSWLTATHALNILIFMAIYELLIRKYLGPNHPLVLGFAFITVGAGLALMGLLWFLDAREEAAWQAQYDSRGFRQEL